MEQFMSWFLANGGYISPLTEVVTDDQGQYHVRVRSGHNVAESERLVSCPHTLTFSYASIQHSELKTKACEATPSPISQDIVLRLLFMEQYLLGEKSFWWPYISIIPQPSQRHGAYENVEESGAVAGSVKTFHTPLYFDEEDKLWLHGTNLGVATKQRATDWRDEFEAANHLVAGLNNHEQHLWTSDLYIWAATVFTSRSFSSSALRIPGLDSPVLIPGVDLLNHSPSAKVTWAWGIDACAVQTNARLMSGDQVFNNYGPKGNEELLMGYGFCLDPNQADCFNLSYSPALSQHIDQAKTKRKNASYAGHLSETTTTKPEGNSSDNPEASEVGQSSGREIESNPLKDVKFVMLGNNDYRFSTGFLADCSLALLNGRERNQHMACNLDAYKFSSNSLSRNKLHTLCSIMMILQDKRAEIRKHDNDFSFPPRTQNQSYASIYRSSQSGILNGVLACLSSTLQTITQLKFQEQSRVIHLKDILMTTSRPKQLKPHFREVVHAGVGSRDPHKVSQRRGVEFAFAVWLCGLRLLHLHDSDGRRRRGEIGDFAALSTTDPVLYSWIGFLCSHYPSSQPDQPGDGEEEESDLAKWLAGMATASSSINKPQEVADTAASYIKAIKATGAKHPDSLYNHAWAHDLRNLMWCLVVAREERVRCPTVSQSGELGLEDEDEFVLVIDLDEDEDAEERGESGMRDSFAE